MIGAVIWLTSLVIDLAECVIVYVWRMFDQSFDPRIYKSINLCLKYPLLKVQAHRNRNLSTEDMN